MGFLHGGLLHVRPDIGVVRRRHTEGYDGLPDLGAVKEFVLGAEQTAAAYARNYGGTVREIKKAQRVNAAFQQVLDHPQAAEALEHPALAPLLAEASD